MNMLSYLADLTNPFPTSVQPTSSTLQNILNFVFLIVGGLALIFIVIGAFRYIVSGGEPQDTNQAKNTIMYASIGLLVTIGASVIVNFVIGKL